MATVSTINGTENIDYKKVTQANVYTTAVPLDARFLVEDKDIFNNGQEGFQTSYPGMMTYVVGKHEGGNSANFQIGQSEDAGLWIRLPKVENTTDVFNKSDGGLAITQMKKIFDKRGNFLYGMTDPDGNSVLDEDNHIKNEYLNVDLSGLQTELIQGSNVILTPDTNSGKVRIDVTIPSYVDDIVEGEMKVISNESSDDPKTYQYFQYTVGTDIKDNPNITIAGTTKYIGSTVPDWAQSKVPGTIDEGISGVIYVDSNTNPTRAYRWSGSTLVEIVSQSVSRILNSDITALF